MKYFAILTLFISACTGLEPDTAQATFYANTLPGKWNLFIDGVDQGFINEVGFEPSCGNGAFPNMMLAPGEHEYQLVRQDSTETGETIVFDIDAGSCLVIRVHK